jgi:hypothetical protein
LRTASSRRAARELELRLGRRELDGERAAQHGRRAHQLEREAWRALGARGQRGGVPN